MEDTDANTPPPPPEEDSAANAAPLPTEANGDAPAPETVDETRHEPDASAPAALGESPAIPESTEPAETAVTGTAPADQSAEDSIDPLLARAMTQRLSPPEEERAIGLLRDQLMGKKDEFLAAVALLPKLGWAVSSKAVGVAWPDLKATAKTGLLKFLAADESDASRRIRLSIGRALFKIPDPAAALKLIAGVSKELRDKDTGAISQKDAQIFANVMIGKGKPWIAQLPLAEAKPADIDVIVHAGVSAAFALNQAPLTQIGMLKWAAEAGRLEKLSESALALVIKGVGRMSGKWQGVLRKEIAELPEAIAAALKPALETPAEPQRRAERSRRPEANDELPAELRTEAPREDVSPAEDDDDDEDDDDLEGEDGGPKPPRRERPVYVSKTIPSKEQRSPERAPHPSQSQQHSPAPASAPGPKGAPVRSLQFNAADMLRQLEAHIGFLKGELKSAESKLRTRDDDRRQVRKKPDVPVITGEPTLEELARLNVQLESRITELQARIVDLTTDAEARAVSSGAFNEVGETNPEQQLRTLLSLKLQEAYADFKALETEDRDIVVQQHYRTVLREVFDVLKTEGVPLEPPAAGN